MLRGLCYCVLVMLSALASVGCDESLSNLTGPTPELEPTFSSIQQNIFSSGDASGRPACTSCHNAVGSRFNGLDLSPAVSYNNLVNVASLQRPGVTRVLPNEPDASYLIRKLEGGPNIAGVRMPLNGPFLAEGQILVIRRWIEIGAPNN